MRLTIVIPFSCRTAGISCTWPGVPPRPPPRSASPRSMGRSTRRSCQWPPMPPMQRDICSTRGRARCQPGRSISAGSKRRETLFRSRRICTCTSGITFSSARRSACSCSLVDPTSPPSTLLWIDRSGKPGRALGEPGLFAPRPRLSPDGRKVAVDVFDTAKDTMDIWIYDAATGVRDQVRRWLVADTQESRLVSRGRSHRLLFLPQGPEGGTTLFVKPINGASKEVLLESADENSPGRLVTRRPFRFAFYAPESRQESSQIWVLNLVGDRKTTAVRDRGASIRRRAASRRMAAGSHSRPRSPASQRSTCAPSPDPEGSGRSRRPAAAPRDGGATGRSSSI